MNTDTERFYLHSRSAVIAIQSIDRIIEEQIIGMVVARPGIGKTQALKAWRRKRGASCPHVWIEADVLTSPRPILTALVQGLAIGRTAGAAMNMYRTKQQVCEELARNPIAVLIDEADLLTVRTFELLRSIWDRVSDLRDKDGEAGFPLALFGTPQLRNMLDREDLERLRRRTFHKAELPGANLAELRQYVRAKWPEYPVDEDAAERILRISQGSFGWVNDVMKIAVRLAAKDGKRVTAAIVEATKKHLIGLPEED